MRGAPARNIINSIIILIIRVSLKNSININIINISDSA